MGPSCVWGEGCDKGHPKSVMSRFEQTNELTPVVMESEIIMAMRLLGITKIDQITPGMVECLQEVWT